MEKIKKDKEKQAALNTYVLWAWLERNPGKSKFAYPLFYELGYANKLFQCNWCSYYYAYNTCHEECPLSRRILFRRSYICFKKSSLYNKWHYYMANESKLNRKSNCPVINFYYKMLMNYYKKRAQIAAGEIARIAWKEYKRLGG